MKRCAYECDIIIIIIFVLVLLMYAWMDSTTIMIYDTQHVVIMD